MLTLLRNNFFFSSLSFWLFRSDMFNDEQLKSFLSLSLSLFHAPSVSLSLSFSSISCCLYFIDCWSSLSSLFSPQSRIDTSAVFVLSVLISDDFFFSHFLWLTCLCSGLVVQLSEALCLFSSCSASDLPRPSSTGSPSAKLPPPSPQRKKNKTMEKRKKNQKVSRF